MRTCYIVQGAALSALWLLQWEESQKGRKYMCVCKIPEKLMKVMFKKFLNYTFYMLNHFKR